MKLNMYLIDWAIVPVWCSIFALGLKWGTVIMLPVMLVFAIFNALYAKKTFSLMLTDINLMMASVTGIIINSILFTRFIYADRMNVSSMMAAIFVSVFYLTFIMIITLTVKDVKRRRRQRIINHLAYDDDGNEEAEEDDYDDDDELLYDDEDKMSVERRMASRLLHKSEEGDEEDEEDPRNKEPKFKVIKKK